MFSNEIHSYITQRASIHGYYRLKHTLVMIRHGESLWNKENRFTGWCDIPLTKQGELDAIDAGRLLKERKLNFDSVFTSELERAWRTCSLILSQSGLSGVEVIQSWRLNERHYGVLQGHAKNSALLTKIYGANQLVSWRREFKSLPPSIYDADVLRSIGENALTTCTSTMNSKYIDRDLLAITKSCLRSDKSNSHTRITSKYPSTESLADCQHRAYGYWENIIAPKVLEGQRILIVSHANTIRALIKAIDKIDDETITHLKIPNGVPLVYSLDDGLNPIDTTDQTFIHGSFLVSAHNHQKVIKYESSNKRKLKAIFEFCDRDNDGKVNLHELIDGLHRLHDSTYAIDSETDHDSIFEFEAEEIIRTIPIPNGNGDITLQEFLSKQATVLPYLSKLKLIT